VEAIFLGLSLAVTLPLGAITALKGKWGVLVLGLVFWPAWVLGAIRLARPDSYWARRFYDNEKRGRAQRVAPFRRKLAIAGAAVLIVLLAALLGLLKLYRIPSSAMEPTLLCARGPLGCSADESDRVIGLRYIVRRQPNRGDLVAFKVPDDGAEKCGSSRDAVFIKRVIGLPGESWALRNGFVYIDGRRLRERYVPMDRRDLDPLSEERIPAGHYLVLGDNRLQSCDSRVWGPLPRDRLVAKVVFRYWPLDRLGTP
jgi:signal peptidase I